MVAGCKGSGGTGHAAVRFSAFPVGRRETTSASRHPRGRALGVEAALYAASLKLSFSVFERGKVGEHLLQWGHVRLFTPFGMNSTALGKVALRTEQPRRDMPGDNDLLTGKEHLAAYLEPLAGLDLMREHIHTQTTVVRIGRRGFFKHEGAGDPRRGQQPFRLLLRNAGGQERDVDADVVLDCTGVYGNPRCLGEGGVPAVGESAVRPYIAWGLEDVLGGRRDHYADRNILVIGAGHSAATTVCQLASLAQQAPSTWIVWLARRGHAAAPPRSQRPPARTRPVVHRANMLATRGEGNVEFYPQSIVERIEMQGKGTGFTVHALTNGEERSWQVDRVVANVGGDPDNQLYRELQVHECPASFAPMGLSAALLKTGASGAGDAAQPRAGLLPPRQQKFWPARKLPAADRLRAGARRIRAHRQ